MVNRRNAALIAGQDDIPDMGDPDRKRMLNVIAQRRYRQRQREKLNQTGSKKRDATLQSSLSTPSSVNDHKTSTMTTNAPLISENSYGGFSLTADVISTHPMPVFDFFDTETAGEGSTSSSSFSSKAADFRVYPDAEFYTDFGELADLELSQFTFPDTSNLEVPILKLFNVGMTIAGLLRCADTIWDPTFTRIVTAMQFSNSVLPTNLLPTPIQGQVPHHPILDILPWPSVRTKLIMVFAQPAHLRPPIARDETCVMRLLQDVDDEKDGVRIANCQGNDADALCERSWEIGSAFYRNWWWALNTDVVERSNQLRRDRGAGPLTLTPGSI